MRGGDVGREIAKPFALSYVRRSMARAVLQPTDSERSDPVISKLDVLVRYWQLVARHAHAGGPELTTEERSELLGLMQLMGDDGDVPPPASVPRGDGAHPAQLIGEGTVRTVELRAMSPRALLVATPTPPSVGARVVLRVADAVAGVEYIIPCRVEWVHAGAPASAALAVDGAPTRTDFDGLAAPTLREATREGLFFAERRTPLLG